jgi:hypothetical protein
MSASTLRTLKNQEKLLELAYLSVSVSFNIPQNSEILEDFPLRATGGAYK